MTDSITTKRQLVIIGGAEDRDGDSQILREFVRRAGGIKARIVIMTAAAELPRDVGENYIRVFERLGAEGVRIIDTETREDASSSTALEAIAQATGIFFTGGDQARITSILKDTQIDTAIHQRFSEGIVVAGTSAGAAVMPDNMIVEGDAQTHPRMEIVAMGPGLGFLPGVVIDQHFSQRGRLGRLLSALVQEPAGLGFGIDENTAMVVTDHQIEVIGEGSITIIDESEATYNNMGEVLKDEPLAIFGAKLHILPHGYKFDLKTRQPIVNQSPVANVSIPLASTNI
ncbi:cyanophycinase [Nodularia sphaerocarpa]|uniref:cyanophycinase n=1 Tax=Nodularia sphaerocarpa TaxID=137816 RepID=UPI001EFB7FCB|nr:cyanophycinase [Nodularia sphaerocarpa]MDB9376078.1 cyanophycinase [Nodularia sphaerocarpa CS-585]MDB9379928.1 cyanophycinase [Nodularia sphaerocarpa CS-585A2]ULP72050.1 Cyanophycinase [Nodularia sphaerocarpa UHCC 0038]